MGYWHHVCCILRVCSFSPPLLVPAIFPSRKQQQRMYIAVKEWLFRNRICAQNFQKG